MREVWRDIAIDLGFYTGMPFYRVSSNGRFRIKERIFRVRDDSKTFHCFPKIMKQQLDRRGYCKISLLTKYHGQRSMMAHRVVAITFIPNPANKPEVNHINGIKTDNRIENLEWCTSSENQLHAFKLGLQECAIGEKNGMAKLTNKQVLEIFNSNQTTNQLSDKYPVNKASIRRIRSGELWSKITGKQNIRKKFMPELALSIYHCPLSIEETANKYSTTYKQVHAIKKGISWGSLTGKIYIPNKNFFHAK